MRFNILYLGEDRPGSRAPQRLRAMRELGHAVEFIRSHPEGETYETPPSLAKRVRHRLRRPGDPAQLNRRVIAAAEQSAPDFVWFDYTLMIRPDTLHVLKRAWPDTKLIWYAEDDMFQRHNSSVWIEKSVGLFDLWVTTKSFNARNEEMPARGARRVLFVNNSFDRSLHRPVALTDADRSRYAADVSFVGTFEQTRADSLIKLSEAGISVRVWGNGWRHLAGKHSNLSIESGAIYGDDLAKVYCGSAINLAFLRKINRDLQTCRTVEIPACGGFMLHERTDEACAILSENEQAGYFADDRELLEKCGFWMARPDARKAIAKAGWQHITTGGFCHQERINQILTEALEV